MKLFRKRKKPEKGDKVKVKINSNKYIGEVMNKALNQFGEDVYIVEVKSTDPTISHRIVRVNKAKKI